MMNATVRGDPTGQAMAEEERAVRSTGTAPGAVQPRESGTHTGALDQADHPEPGHPEIEHERPEDWGWHLEMGRTARIAGWVSAAVLLILNVGNQTRHEANVWLTVLALLLVAVLIWDHYRRKNSWRG